MAQDQKGARAKSAWLVFFDESGISLLAVTRRTWSPRGQTPILRHRCNWKRASMAAALGYHASDADRGPRLCFQVQQDSYNTQTLIGVLERLAGFYAGQQVVLVWDGLGAPWSHDMQAWLATQRHWLQVERLPAYAPELAVAPQVNFLVRTLAAALLALSPGAWAARRDGTSAQRSVLIGLAG